MEREKSLLQDNHHLYVDPKNAVNMKLADEYKAKGPQGPDFFDTHRRGNETSFPFFVLVFRGPWPFPSKERKSRYLKASMSSRGSEHGQGGGGETTIFKVREHMWIFDGAGSFCQT